MTLTTERTVRAAQAIDITESKPGDVLLSFGAGRLAELVKIFDGGDYSHASICKNQKLIEAGLSGVVSYPIQKLVDEQQHVDLYRFVSDNQEIMGSHSWPPTPVVEVAEKYLGVGTTYANNQLYLAGVLVLTRRIPLGDLGKAATRALMAALFKMLTRIKTGDTQRSVVCSELVYRSFYEALPEKKYGLSIAGTIRPAFSEGSEREIQVPETKGFAEQLEAELNQGASFGMHSADASSQQQIKFERQDPIDQLSELKKMLHEVNRIPSPQMRANPLVAPGMVSPRDLQKSPNLRFLGRIRKSS